MNLTRCSELAVVSLVLLAAVVGGTAAQSAAGSAPEPQSVGGEIEITYTVTDLFSDVDVETWRLNISTQLDDPQWRIEYRTQGGDVVNQTTPTVRSTTLDRRLTSDSNVTEIRVTVQGTVPGLAAYTYPQPERFTLLQLRVIPSTGLDEEIETVRVQHYTGESREARNALDEARDAIGDPEGDSEAAKTYRNAVSAYEAGEFDLAINLAQEATEKARSSQESRTILYGALGAVALLLVIGGGVYWYRSRQNTYDKLG